MNEDSPIHSHRQPLRAVEKLHHTVTGSSFARNLRRIATSPEAKIAYVVIGSVGLAALAVAIVGPKRLERQVIRPLRSAIEPQTDRLWAQARPLREQIAGLFREAHPSARERLVKNFQSWIGHFHAT